MVSVLLQLKTSFCLGPGQPACSSVGSLRVQSLTFSESQHLSALKWGPQLRTRREGSINFSSPCALVTDPPGCERAPGNRCGVSSPEPRSEDDDDRLNCLSLNLRIKLDSPPLSPHWIRLLKIPPRQPALSDRLDMLTVFKAKFRLPRQEESVPRQSFIFLKSVTFPKSAES